MIIDITKKNLLKEIDEYRSRILYEPFLLMNEITIKLLYYDSFSVKFEENIDINHGDIFGNLYGFKIIIDNSLNDNLVDIR